MTNFINHDRPPAFCPGCSHETVVKALDGALSDLGMKNNEVVLVSDIGCSGLFDTFFNTHALHGLHGRALTYATGIKLARPDLTVIVTMGDGGLGIGGAHVLSTCRRNIDLTLLVLNNFNYGMTGGQCSSTTPPAAQVASGFLNRLEQPLDICRLAGEAGAGLVNRLSAYDADLIATVTAAIQYEGFSVLDIWGICTGRFTRKNKITPKTIAADLKNMPSLAPFSVNRSRSEYGAAYRSEAAKVKNMAPPQEIEAVHSSPSKEQQEILFLGGAGQRIVTAGELLCLAGVTAGLYTTQKNDYPITVMRGHSVSEMILSSDPILYTGIEIPQVVVALGQEGIDRRRRLFEYLPEATLVLAVDGVHIPACRAAVERIGFKKYGIKPSDWALAALAWLAAHNRILTPKMLFAALPFKFKDPMLKAAAAVCVKVIHSLQV